MKKITLNNKGLLVKKDIEFFGGKHSLLERITMGGIGSPKLIYKSGIPYFDEIEIVENEISFVNFELMKNGFLIRLHRNLRLRYVGFQLKEILKIQLVEIKDYSVREERKLIIKTVNHTIEFDLFFQNYQSVLSFFQKKLFQDVFEIV